MKLVIVKSLVVVACIVAAGAGAFAQTTARANPTDTPRELVATYQTLADTILGAKQTEWNLVDSILASAYAHALALHEEAQAKLKAGQTAGGKIEKLATLVTQLANEGDASVAAVRKRLIEGGHHHNAEGEKLGKFDEGFVIVTRDVKKTLLDAAKAIARLGEKPSASALSAEWAKVEQAYRSLHPGK